MGWACRLCPVLHCCLVFLSGLTSVLLGCLPRRVSFPSGLLHNEIRKLALGRLLALFLSYLLFFFFFLLLLLCFFFFLPLGVFLTLDLLAALEL